MQREHVQRGRVQQEHVLCGQVQRGRVQQEHVLCGHTQHEPTWHASEQNVTFIQQQKY